MDLHNCSFEAYVSSLQYSYPPKQDFQRKGFFSRPTDAVGKTKQDFLVRPPFFGFEMEKVKKKSP